MYCHLCRRYEVPPAEDALSPDNVLGINATISGDGLEAKLKRLIQYYNFLYTTVIPNHFDKIKVILYLNILIYTATYFQKLDIKVI